MIKKIGLSIILIGIAGAASATASQTCEKILLWTICGPTPVNNPSPVKAPEIDPASAIAGLTLMFGGLAVLRGRRKKDQTPER